MNPETRLSSPIFPAYPTDPTLPHMSRITLSHAAFCNNIHVFKEILQRKTLCAVVKANAYGHGLDLIVPSLVNQGVNTFAVSYTQEAAWIRHHYPTARIIVLCDPLSRSWEDVIRLHLEPVINDHQDFSWYLAHQSVFLENTLKVHFKLDTGMGRLGILPQDFMRMFSQMKLPTTTPIGLMTHFASGESPHDPLTKRQGDVFLDMIAFTKNMHPHVECHAANSGATLNRLLFDHTDMVRIGIGMYGGIEDPRLYGVMSWKTRIHHIRHLSRGQTVGYLHTWQAARDTRIATIPVGYRLGYRISQSNRGMAKVAGVHVPVIGRISMDMTCLDITDVPIPNPLLFGREVVLLSGGLKRSPETSIFALAEQTQTLTYEVFCTLHSDIQRSWVVD